MTIFKIINLKNNIQIMEKLNVLIICYLLQFINTDEIFESTWRDYPACRLGRLQSPIEIKEYESTYTNDFSFVYQNYKDNLNLSINITDNTSYALKTEDIPGGYINFERRGVIKQYEFIRAELYPGLHPIDGELPDYELHLVHQKNLDFNTNKNQYRTIQDPNMFLRVVLRYKKAPFCASYSSDNNLLDNLLNNDIKGLNDYLVFLDKRAYFYEGSSINIPCDENVNYYVINDLFCIEDSKTRDINLPFKNLTTANKFGRPLYKNFMNYREVMNSNYIPVKIISLLYFLFILF